MTKRVRAIIVENKQVLLLKRIFADRVYWVFPGGRVEANESTIQALKRECKEELGVDIQTGTLFTTEVSEKNETLGHIEHYYFAEIIGGVIGDGHGQEHQNPQLHKGTYEIVWVDVSMIDQIDLRPNTVRDKLLNYKHNYFDE